MDTFIYHTAIQYENIMKYATQYLKGSLCDWQMGDFMIGISCNAAGDLRIFYTVQDPMIICPILGYVRNVGTISNKW